MEICVVCAYVCSVVFFWNLDCLWLVIVLLRLNKYHHNNLMLVFVRALKVIHQKKQKKNWWLTFIRLINTTSNFMCTHIVYLCNTCHHKFNCTTPFIPFTPPPTPFPIIQPFKVTEILVILSLIIHVTNHNSTIKISKSHLQFNYEFRLNIRSIFD